MPLGDGFGAPVLVGEDGREVPDHAGGEGINGGGGIGELFVDFQLGAEVVDCGYVHGGHFGAAGGRDVAGVRAAVDEILAGGAG